MPQGVSSTADAGQALIARVQTVLDTGFDFAESTVGNVMALTEDELDTVIGKGIRLPVCNSFIPPTFSIMKRDTGLEAYVDESMRRMMMLGTDTVVLGSGGARRIPEGMSHSEGISIFKDFLTMCNGYGKKYGITVAIEPLNHKECNLLNRVGEGYLLAKELGLDNVQLLADAYHMAVENEPHSTLKCYTDMLCHVHVSQADRAYPGKNAEDKYIPAFIQSLKESGYQGRITVECGFDDFESNALVASAYLKKIL